jgi:cell division protein FtsZ
MGIGSSRGDDRAVAAAEMAISSPLLEASIDGAHGVLLSIQGGSDLGLFEINEAAQLVSNSAAVDANIIFGAVIDDALGDEVRVTVIAAGFDEARPNRPAVAVPIGGGRSTGGSAAGSGGANGGWEARAGSAAGSATAETRGSGGSAASSAAGGSAAWGSTGSTGFSAGSGVSGGSGFSGGSGVSGAEDGTSWAEHGSGLAAHASGTAASGITPATPGAGVGGATGDSITDMPAQPAADDTGYVPAPVSFVSPDEDEEYAVTPGYPADPRDDRAGDGTPAGGSSGWKDSGRPGSGDKVFDVSAGRRRPVVFEEDDDLDVPDFLK